MILYLDTSALVKRYIQEPESPHVALWIERADLFATSLITRAEMAAVIGRARRMKAMGEAKALYTLLAFRNRWPTYVRLPIFEQTVNLADELAWEHGLRGYDAIHLATAVMWQEALLEPVTMATYDRQLWDSAREAGLRVLPEM